MKMTNDKQALLRKIPAVDQLLASPVLEKASGTYPRGLILRSINQVLDDLRAQILEQRSAEYRVTPSIESVAEKVIKRLEALSRPSLRPAINATGVVVHTNLGRSILAEKILQNFRPLAGGYSNLEYDLKQGKRGSRYTHVENILIELTSAEAAMVVNNNAAAVLVALETLAKNQEVIVSRGQLVEIGGSFRIPDVMRKSGAVMIEVGTTNKTHLQDFEEATGPETALLLQVHTSNFQIVGFTEQPALPELVKLSKRYGIPVMVDLGSGCLVDFTKYGLIKEPTVQEILSQGADLVTFSGDKLLGGPQAGIILGRKDLVEAIKKNQLTRALRIDKLTLLALEETLRLYRDEKTAVAEIPTLRMICEDYNSLTQKGKRLLDLTGKLDSQNFSVELAEGNSMVGGGALPLLRLPSRLLRLVPKKLSSHFMETWLRSYDPPIIARLEKEMVLFDVRTIQEMELETIAEAVKRLAHLGTES